MHWKSALLSGVFAAIGIGALTGGAAAAGPTCANGTIKVGAVSTITGPADFSEVPKATQAAFDAVNAAGGINGCKIEYTIADDKADPAVAAQAARDLIDNKEAVALVLSVQGLGVDAACFSSPSVAPVNVGPFTLSTAMGYYATNVLKSQKFCAFFIIIGGTQEAYKKGIEDWEKITGQKVHLLDLTLPFQGDLTPYVIKARDAGCDTVLTNQVEPQVVQLMAVPGAGLHGAGGEGARRHQAADLCRHRMGALHRNRVGRQRSMDRRHEQSRPAAHRLLAGWLSGRQDVPQGDRGHRWRSDARKREQGASANEADLRSARRLALRIR